MALIFLLLGFKTGSPLRSNILVTAAALVIDALTFTLILLAEKLTAPPISGSGGDNCSAFTNVLIVAALYLSDLAVVVTELELTFVDLLLSLVALFSFAAILFGSETNVD